MKNLFKISLLFIASVFVTACGTQVSVEPAEVGKILGKNGFKPDIIPPSKFRLDPCLFYCDKLIVLEVSDKPLLEQFPSLFMPKDKLKLAVEVRGTYSIPNDKKSINMIFDRIPATGGKIKAETVYETYGKQAIRGIVRSELVKYSIAEILENRDALSVSIHQAINEKLKNTNTPLIVSRFELAKILPPEVIVKAQEAAKEREIAIQQEEANARVAMVKAERDLEIAKKQRLVERERALAIAEQNKIAAKSVTPELLKYRQLEVFEKVMPEVAKYGNLIIIPIDMKSLDTTDDAAVFSKILGKTIKGTSHSNK